MVNPLDSLLDAPQPDIAPAPERQWSAYQQEIFEAIKTPEMDVLCQAVAGSGKTTTIVKGIEFAPGRSLFMAFNRSIAQEIAQRLIYGEVRTLNSLGHGLVMKHHRGAKLDQYKVDNLLKFRMLKDLGGDDLYREYGYTLKRMIGLAKNAALVSPGTEDFKIFFEPTDIPEDLYDSLAYVCEEVFEQSINLMATFDFDDQLYIPWANDYSFPSYSSVFIDECQDLSPIQHEMLWALKTQGARIVAVGDRHQAIYGFRGACVDSMDLLKKRFGMLELPLSICYRCPTSVVEVAKGWCPTIEAAPGAPDGCVSYLTLNDKDPNLWSGRSQLILCRTNAPLFRAILRHVREGSPCRVSSSFLDSFHGFVRHFKTSTTDQLRSKLDLWYTKEFEAARKRGSKAKMAMVQDKYDTVKVISLAYKTTDQVLRMIENLSASERGPLFSTVHKAKGLEAPEVFILRPDLMPSAWAQGEDAELQEQNLMYVAATRAQSTLTYGVPAP